MAIEQHKTHVASPNAADAKAKDDAAAKSRAEATKLEAQAAEDRAKAEHAKLTPEQVKANESAQKADDARAKAAEEERKARGTTEPMTVSDAKVSAPVDPAMPVNHHLAQKFGNDPANPKHAPGISAEPEHATVRLSRKTPDHPDLVHSSCHPDMVGDYLRAGWNRDEVQPGAYPLTKEEQAAADKRAETARA